MRIRIVAVLNQKGGVGKTTLCHHLAGALAAAGTRVLLVDNDPQTSLTRGVLGPAPAAAVAAGSSILTAYDQGWHCGAIDVAWPGVPGVLLLPGSPYLREVDRQDDASNGLAEYLRRTADSFDVALIDCPPSIGGSARSALIAADHLLIPVQPEDFSAQGIAPVLDAATPFFESGGWASIVISQYHKRLALHRLMVEAIRETHGVRVLDATIPILNDYRKGIHLNIPAQHLDARSTAAVAIRRLAAELAPRAGIPVPHPIALAETEAAHHG